MIRPAQHDDVAVIVELIRDLASFEESLDEVEITTEMLQHAMFGDDPSIRVLVAVIDELVVGMAMYFRTFSTWTGRIGLYLEDLYVRPEFRGQGIGTDLLRAVAHLTTEQGGARFEWSVLNWNQKAIDVYETIGGVAMGEWTRYRLAGEALTNFARDDHS